jgi:two-component SAPR family response regulator
MVLDVRLPGVSGLDFQEQLAKANVSIPIIFITAHGDVPMTSRAMKAGAIEFLMKPFQKEDLLAASPCKTMPLVFMTRGERDARSFEVLSRRTPSSRNPVRSTSKQR